MQSSKKTDFCLNCEYPLDDSHNYCPNCGQENSSSAISFGKLLKDFYSNYFSIDSRFGRSIKPFFLKPGFLTNQFLKGRRVHYAHPVRLYLLISLVHFFVLSIYTNVNESEMGEMIAFQIGDDEVSNESTPNDSVDVKNNNKTGMGIDVSVGDDEMIIIKQMIQNNLTIREISDSLHLEEKPFLERHLTLQLIKVLKSNENSVRNYIIENIPILMFLMLPFYALLLKMFFYKQWYINHLIHSLHLHSFALFIMTIYWIISLLFKPHGLLSFSFFIISLIYLIFSFRNTYEITLKKSVFKVIFSGLVYSVFIFIFFLLEMFFSFLTF